ncbi:MAG: ABC transporter ATP-binding protein, partial [Motilibacteraceae bacterium]
MSTSKSEAPALPAPRPPRPPMRGGGPGHGPFGGMGMPAEKALDFRSSGRRLAQRLAPERLRVGAVLVLGVLSVAGMVLGPKILGRATDIIFSGVVGKQLPAGTTKEQAVQAARAAGRSNIADMLARMDLVPGRGIDTTALAHVLLLALGLYVVASLLSW